MKREKLNVEAAIREGLGLPYAMVRSLSQVTLGSSTGRTAWKPSVCGARTRTIPLTRRMPWRTPPSAVP